MPAISRMRYKQLLEDYTRFEQASEESPFNRYVEGTDKSLGLVVTGLGWNYVNEIFPDGVPFPTVKVSQYPIPTKMIGRLFDECDAVMVIEEGQPLVERKLRGALDRTGVIYGKPDRRT